MAFERRQGSAGYELPPLSIMLVRNANDFVPPKYQKNILLEISYENHSFLLEQNDPREMLESLNWHLHRCDPDILLTHYGDSKLLPVIAGASQNYEVPLLLNRDDTVHYRTTKESSFFQYGKIVHKDGAFTLSGRWHVDADNSFTISNANLDGLLEMTRLTQMCGQRQGRASIGTSMSSMQLSWAYRNNILIPAKKREAEDFKSAETLLLADRGGLIFNPPVGYHEMWPNWILFPCIRALWSITMFHRKRSIAAAVRRTISAAAFRNWIIRSAQSGAASCRKRFVRSSRNARITRA